MIGYFKKSILNVINAMGYDLVWKRPSEKAAFLGLKRYPIRSILDVGANRGQFARLARTVFPDSRIYCFEPLPDAYNDLQIWAEKQDGNVLTFNMAIGNDSCSVNMHLHREHDDSSSILATTELYSQLYPFSREQIEISVSQTTLDDFMINAPSPPESELLIKMDVQGYEERVIEGGTSTLAKARACIIEICIDKLYEKQSTFDNIYRMMRHHGYRYAGNLEQVLAADGHVIYFDSIFIRNDE